MAFCTPQTYHEQTLLKTKAYAIETEQTHFLEVMRVFKAAYQHNHEFVQFQMRAQHPEAYLRCIQQQTKLMASTRVIVLNYVGRDVMFYLSDHILAMNGVHAVLPAPTVDMDGRYRVQVDKDDFHSIRKELMTCITPWYNDLVRRMLNTLLANILPHQKWLQ